MLIVHAGLFCGVRVAVICRNGYVMGISGPDWSNITAGPLAGCAVCSSWPANPVDTMTYQPVRVPRLADAIVKELEAIILDGVLKPGDRLPPERQLSEQLGVSRASLREAIKQMAARGLLESRQGGGTFVTNRLDRTFAGPWQEMLAQHPNLREDVLEFRRMMEGQVAALAAVRATEADRARLVRLYDELEAACQGDDLARQSRADVAFHLGIADAAHNAMLAHLMAGLLDMLASNIHENVANLFHHAQPVAGQLLAQHRAIQEAVLAGRPDEARQAAEGHIHFIHSTLTSWRDEARRIERASRRLAVDDMTG